MSTQQPPKTVWKTDEQGRTTFRLSPPLVLWWVWAAFAVGNLIDLAVQSRDWFSLQIAVALLAITGLMYACALRPRVISDAGGLTVINPFRDYRVPWGGVAGVSLGDSVEIRCEQPPPKKPKVIYSWGLYSPRRTRARAELRQAYNSRRQQSGSGPTSRGFFWNPGASVAGGSLGGAGYGRMPAEGKSMASKHASHVMAGELARRCDTAKAAGTAPEGMVTGRWAWLPIAAVLIPVATFIGVVAGH